MEIVVFIYEEYLIIVIERKLMLQENNLFLLWLQFFLWPTFPWEQEEVEDILPITWFEEHKKVLVCLI